MMVESGEPAPEMVPVDIQSFRNATREISFDVYLRLGEGNFAHIFSRTTGLDYKRLAQYMQKGVTQLHIRQEDLASFQAFVARPAHVIFSDPQTPQDKKIAMLLNMTEQNISELFTQFEVNEDTAASTQRVVGSYVELLSTSPNTLATILKLVSHGEYLYYHSIAVAIFSIFLAKATGQFNRQMIEHIGMGGFLHDVGATHLPKEIVCSPTELDAEQWVEMRAHTTIGMRMLEGTTNVADEVRYMVYQHHEEPGGKGYPNGLLGPVIYYPAKIVALADAFSALISKRPFRAAYSVEQAIHLLEAGNGQKHDRELVNLMKSIFLRSNSSIKKAS